MFMTGTALVLLVIAAIPPFGQRTGVCVLFAVVNLFNAWRLRRKSN